MEILDQDPWNESQKYELHFKYEISENKLEIYRCYSSEISVKSPEFRERNMSENCVGRYLYFMLFEVGQMMAWAFGMGFKL